MAARKGRRSSSKTAISGELTWSAWAQKYAAKASGKLQLSDCSAVHVFCSGATLKEYGQIVYICDSESTSRDDQLQAFKNHQMKLHDCQSFICQRITAPFLRNVVHIAADILCTQHILIGCSLACLSLRVVFSVKLQFRGLKSQGWVRFRFRVRCQNFKPRNCNCVHTADQLLRSSPPTSPPRWIASTASPLPPQWQLMFLTVSVQQVRL